MIFKVFLLSVYIRDYNSPYTLKIARVIGGRLSLNGERMHLFNINTFSKGFG